MQHTAAAAAAAAAAAYARSVKACTRAWVAKYFGSEMWY
jgi:hypothetical protein